MSDKELEDKIKRQVKLELDLDNLVLNHSDLKKDIHGIKKLLEDSKRKSDDYNTKNTEDHNKYDFNYVTLMGKIGIINDKVEVIAKKDILDIVVLTIRNHPKTSTAVIFAFLLKDPITMLFQYVVKLVL